ncbi:uncharacterized protein K441DRAFT_542881, partial [Cenococcum geophilum 1.58]|uniref:uncharacterized protein n=1 Tax=Cenococcum geophilum 1.58 TaxID=794803 RepID=UPI00358E0FEC
LFYIAVNTFYIGFKVLNILTAKLQAVNILLINIVLNFTGSYLSFLIDILKVPLSIY